MNSQPSSGNPFSSPETEPAESATSSPVTGRQAYNIVSDTIVGMNVRKSDNLFQFKVILVCVLIGAPSGAIAGALFSASDSRAMGALWGALVLSFAGVILGLFGSGIYLMFYRAARHFKGKHD